MAGAALPTLPSDVLNYIACAALTATGSIKEARIRLSLVCRAWRDSLRGTQPALVLIWRHFGSSQTQQHAECNPLTPPCLLPVQCCSSETSAPAGSLLRAVVSQTPRPTTAHRCTAGVPWHRVFGKKATAEQLQMEFARVPLATVQLHRSVSKLPSESLASIVAALAGSAATLTALLGFPLVELQDSPHGGLAAFSQLRVLGLRQNMESPKVLRAAQLPASIETLTLACRAKVDEFSSHECFPPVLVGLHGLQNLRRIRLADYDCWHLSCWDAEEGQHGPVSLPPRLEVCAMCQRLSRSPCAFRCSMRMRVGKTAGALYLTLDDAAARRGLRAKTEYKVTEALASSQTVRMETDAGIELCEICITRLDGSGNYDEQTGDGLRSSELPLASPRPLTLEIRAAVEIRMTYTAQYNRGVALCRS